jgi:hypothetical protein
MIVVLESRRTEKHLGTRPLESDVQHLAHPLLEGTHQSGNTINQYVNHS